MTFDHDNSTAIIPLSFFDELDRHHCHKKNEAKRKKKTLPCQTWYIQSNACGNSKPIAEKTNTCMMVLKKEIMKIKSNEPGR